MSFDFFADESARTLDRAAANPSLGVEPGIWKGFATETPGLIMQGFAKTARAIDLAGSIGPIVMDRLSGGTERQDQYFREHDEIFNRAVDYWTPAPGSVGTAGRVVGAIVPKLAEVLIAPGLAVSSEILNQSEDLVREGVDARKAVAVGVAQGTGLGVGIWAPIFGSSLFTRALVAGAGVNVAQGIVTKLASQRILAGEKAAEQFNPWDTEGLVIDALLGVAFGGLYHASVGGRSAHEAISLLDRDALLVAQQARHMEDTTAPGRFADPTSQTAHVSAVRKAMDDLLNDRPVNVDQVARDVRVTPDAAKDAQAGEVHAEIVRQAPKAEPVIEPLVRHAQPIEPPTNPDVKIESNWNSTPLLESSDASYVARHVTHGNTGHVLTPTEFDKKVGQIAGMDVYQRFNSELALVRPREGDTFGGGFDIVGVVKKSNDGGIEHVVISPDLQRQGIGKALLLMAERTIGVNPLKAKDRSKSGAALMENIRSERVAQERAARPQAETAPDPLLTEARQRIAEHGDVEVQMGTDANGQPVTRKVSELMEDARKTVEQAHADTKLFEVAASCLIGAA